MTITLAGLEAAVTITLAGPAAATATHPTTLKSAE